MPETRELLDYWEESPPAHEMLQLIATSQFIGWERPNARKKVTSRSRRNPPGTRNRGNSEKVENEASDSARNDGAPLSRGKTENAIVVDTKEAMYAAVAQMGMWGAGKVSMNRK